nr:39S ribosomal protein L46, mitochondrial-like [Cherax quadricarinatus]
MQLGVGTNAKWQIVGAACITRPPIVCPPMKPIEQQYSEGNKYCTESADDTSDLGSLNRSQERSLLLVVKQKLGSSYEWSLPQTPWLPGETLRQTCERVVKERCGDSLKVKFLGNAPCGFYKYKYPKNVRANGFIGAKVFFYKAQVIDNNGAVNPGEDIAEYQWLSQNELDDKFRRSYAKSVSQFLVSDQ